MSIKYIIWGLAKVLVKPLLHKTFVMETVANTIKGTVSKNWMKSFEYLRVFEWGEYRRDSVWKLSE